MTAFYRNGEFFSSERPLYEPTLFSLNYSVCAFEGIRSYQIDRAGMYGIFRLEEHIDRFLDSCSYLGLQSQFLERGHLIESVKKLVLCCGSQNLYIRPIAFYGEGIMNLCSPPEVQVVIFASPFNNTKPPSKLTVQVSAFIRDIKTIGKKISRNYFDSYMALKNRDSDFSETLMLDKHNYVTETSAHNVIFKFSEGEFATPSDPYCLPGITRDSAITLLSEQGIEVQKRPISVEELEAVTACILTSTASEVRMVSQLDQKILDDRCPHFAQIIADYQILTRFYNPEQKREWISYVS